MNAGSARRLHRRQPVAGNQDLLRPLRQFQRRVAVVGSVAHIVAKDPGRLLAMSRGGDCGKVHTRDGEEAVSQVPCWRQQRRDGAAVGLAAAGPIGSPSTRHTDIVTSVGFSPGRTLVAGGWDKSLRLVGRGHSPCCGHGGAGAVGGAVWAAPRALVAGDMRDPLPSSAATREKNLALGPSRAPCENCT